MIDSEIVGMFEKRDEDALQAAEDQYGRYVRVIAENILGDHEDAEECAGDTFLAAWNTIPPEKPTSLKAYLGRIARNAALRKLRDRNRAKRGGGETREAIDELAECLPGGETVEETVDQKVLGELINEFLSKLDPTSRGIFLCRYWYFAKTKEIAEKYGLSESNVKVKLLRIRKKLLEELRKAGYQ